MDEPQRPLAAEILGGEPLGRSAPPPGEVARALHLPGRITARVTAFDRRVDDAIAGVRSPTLDRVMYAATELGDFALIWIIVVARGLLPPASRRALRLSSSSSRVDPGDGSSVVLPPAPRRLVAAAGLEDPQAASRASPRGTRPRRSRPPPSSARTIP